MRTVKVNEIIKSSKINVYSIAIFLILFCTAVMNGVAVNIYGVIVKSLMEELQVSTTVAGFLASFQFYGSLIGAVLFPWIGTKIGSKGTIVLSALITTGTTLLMSVTGNVYVFAVCRALCGMSSVGLIPCVIGHVTEYAPGKAQSVMLTTASAGMALGGTLVGFVGGMLMGQLGWRGLMRIQLIMLVFIALFIVFVPDSAASYLRQGKLNEYAKILPRINPAFKPQEGDVYEVNAESKVKQSYTELFKHGLARTTILLGIAAILTMFVNFGLQTMFPLIFGGMGFEESQSAYFLSLFNLAAFVGMPLSGVLSEKFSCKNVLTVQYLVVSALFFCIRFVSGSVAMGLLVFVIGIAFNGIHAARNCYAVESFPLSLSSLALGYAIMMANVGSSIGPTVSGVLLGTNLSSVNIFALYIIPLLGAMLAIRLVNTKKYEEQPNA